VVVSLIFMREHERYAAMAVDRLKDVVGVLEIILFGSVARGDARDDSDIDLVVVLDDLVGGFCAGGFSKFPDMVLSDIRKIEDELSEMGSPKLHIAPYYMSEHSRGIELCGNRGEVDMLDEVGVVKYAAA